jgi:FkbM family methyltransferase
VTTFLASLPAKGVTALHIDFGASLDPLLPPASNKSIASIAFEPVRYSAIKHHIGHERHRGRMFVSPAAVAAEDGEQEMGIWHKYGAASSLAKPVGHFSSTASDSNGKHLSTITVPVLSSRVILDAVPSAIDIWLLKTDMQGFDFKALRGAGEALRRVRYMKTEVWIHNEIVYEGVRNDFCNDFLPYLVSMGFELVELANDGGRTLAVGPAGGEGFCEKQRASKVEPHKTSSTIAYDAFWMRRDLTPLWPPPAVSVGTGEFIWRPFAKLTSGHLVRADAPRS